MIPNASPPESHCPGITAVVFPIYVFFRTLASWKTGFVVQDLFWFVHPGFLSIRELYFFTPKEGIIVVVDFAVFVRDPKILQLAKSALSGSGTVPERFTNG
jgi:hypothetical protein